MGRPKSSQGALRTKNFKDSMKWSNQPRYGLFSYIPFSIGEDTYTRKKKRKKDEYGNVPTKRRQVLSGCNRKGKHMDRCYLQKPGFVSIKDRYLTPYQRGIVLKRMGKVKSFKACDHESGVWKPARNRQVRVQSAYKHKADYNIIKKKKTLNDQGNVKMKEPPNFYTNPPKKGKMRSTPGILLNKQTWKKDEYNRQRQMDITTNQISRKKRRPESFFNMHCGNDPINKSQQVYGLKGKLPTVTKYKKPKFKRPEHEHKWCPNNPGKRGKMGTLQKNLYKYKEDPPRKKGRNKAKEGFQGPIYKPPFKGTLKNPTSSISTKRVNLKKNPTFAKMINTNSFQ